MDEQHDSFVEFKASCDYSLFPELELESFELTLHPLVVWPESDKEKERKAKKRKDRKEKERQEKDRAKYKQLDEEQTKSYLEELKERQRKDKIRLEKKRKDREDNERKEKSLALELPSDFLGIEFVECAVSWSQPVTSPSI